MKKILATVLATLMVFSMSACTKTAEHQLLDVDGNLKGYVVETINKHCTKLEFLDESRNITHTMEVPDEKSRFNVGVFDNFADRTPFKFNSDNSINGVVYIFFDKWNEEKQYYETVKEYYTYPCSGQIMEEYEVAKSKDESFECYTSIKLYNEDGSVKFTFTPKYAKFVNVGRSSLFDDITYMITEYDDQEIEVCVWHYDFETLEFICVFDADGNEIIE